MDRGLWVWNEGCHRGEYAKNVLLATPKYPVCVQCAAGAGMQIATTSVARALWTGSGAVVDGKTEWSGAEVADSMTRLDRGLWVSKEGCHRGEYANVLPAMPKDTAC